MKPALTQGAWARFLSLALLLCLPAFAHATIFAQSLMAGFSSPMYIAYPPDNSNRLFIVERAGVIKILQMDAGATTGTLLATPFLNITSLTTTAGERGLLSM